MPSGGGENALYSQRGGGVCVKHVDNKNNLQVAILSVCSSKTFTAVDRVPSLVHISKSRTMQLFKVAYDAIVFTEMSPTAAVCRVFVCPVMLTAKIRACGSLRVFYFH